MTEQIEKIKGILLVMRDGQFVTGGCCQWQDSALYDSEDFIRTFVLFGKLSGRITTEQNPPNRFTQ